MEDVTQEGTPSTTTVTFQDCMFENNTITSDIGAGGAVAIYNGQVSKTNSGGGTWSVVPVKFINCIFQNNFGMQKGGAAAVLSSSTSYYTAATFAGEELLC